MLPEEGSDEREMIERDIAGPVLLDRRQELVFIGRDMNCDAIVAALEKCEVTRKEASLNQTPKHQTPTPKRQVSSGFPQLFLKV